MYLTCITITQSTIITSPIGFNKGLTNVDARLKQRCINVVPMLCKVVLTLCNVVSTLFQRRALTLYQRCATLKNRRRILFHFQRWINFISTLVQNVETTLIRRWNVGWALSLTYDLWYLFDFLKMKMVQSTYTSCYLIWSDLVAITGVLTQKLFWKSLE